MAVTQESDGNSKKSVKESIQHCAGEGADPKQRKYNGSSSPSTIQKAIMKDMRAVVRSHNLGGNGIKGRISDRLSDLDDIEVIQYLNTKEEIHRKRIFWEAMNEKYMKAKKQKRAAETKKVVAVKNKKATKTIEKVEPKRASSRINYDALKDLGGDLEERCESGESRRADSYAQNSAKTGSNESWYEEDQSDNETLGGDEEDDMQNQYEDDDFYDEFDS